MKKSTIFIMVVLAILNNLSAFSQVNETNNLNNHEVSEKLIIYGSDTCHYCIETKTFLKKNNVEFQYYDIDLNLNKQNEMIDKLNAANISLSNLSLPVVDKAGVIFINNDKFEEFLKILLE